jgi:hypothetical protein
VRLLARVHVALEQLGVPHALIGAAALATHGVSRSTLDLDLLVTDDRVLQPSTWRDVEAEGARVQVRRGDADDPLAGVVRVERTGDRPVDLVVGRAVWQSEMLERPGSVAIGEVTVPVVTAGDLVVLKLYAGGAQDRWDIAQLLAGSDRDAIIVAVDHMVTRLPPRCRALWNELR